MTRTDWQQLAGERLGDARVLLKARRWSAAFYLTGYAVESALKACVVKRVEAEPGLIFVERKFSDKCWTHDFLELIRLADLETPFQAELAANPAFRQCWHKVRNWKEGSRYKTTANRVAKGLYEAVANRHNGVLQWIKGRW